MADRETEEWSWEKIIRQWNEKEKADNAAACFTICSGCTGTKMAKFLLSLCWDQIYAS